MENIKVLLRDPQRKQIINPNSEAAKKVHLVREVTKAIEGAPRSVDVLQKKQHRVYSSQCNSDEKIVERLKELQEIQQKYALPQIHHKPRHLVHQSVDVMPEKQDNLINLRYKNRLTT